MSKTVDPSESRWPRDTWLDAIWESEALKPNERVLAHAFARYAGKKKTTWCSWEELRRRTGIRSKNGVWSALKGLIDSGWLKETAKARQHYSARYELTIPTGQGSSSGTPESTQESPKETAGGAPEVPEMTPEVPEMTPRGPSQGPDISKDLSNGSLQPGGHAAPQTPLRQDDPPGRPTDQSNPPTVVATDQTDLATQPTTRVRRENIVPIFSRQKPENRPCGNCDTWLEPDGTCFNCRGRKAT